MYTVTIYVTNERGKSYNFDDEMTARAFYASNYGTLFLTDNIRHRMLASKVA